MKKILYIAISIMLLIPSIVYAVGQSYIGGEPTGYQECVGDCSSGGSTKGDWALIKGAGVSISLLKVSDSSISLVTHYYIINNWGNTPIYSTYFNTRRNAGGAGSVYGSLSNGNGEYNISPSFGELQAEPADSNWYDDSGLGGYSISRTKIEQALYPNKEFSTRFYKILEKLISGSGELKNALGEYATADKLRDIVDNKNNAEYAALASKLSDYRVAIEPIYNFYDNSTGSKNDDSHRFATAKAIAVTRSAGKNLNKSEVYGGLVGTESDLAKNLFACTEENPGNPFVCNVTLNFNGMKDTLSGYGYGLIKIIDKVKTCDPTKMCCYKDNGEYDESSQRSRNVDNDYNYCKSDKKKDDGTYENCPTDQLVKCKKETPKDCEDAVKTTVCNEDGSSMDAHFYENNNIEKCTLEEGKNSGFMMLDVNFKLDGYSEKHQYCKVACKEDYDIKFPTAKFAASGRYFKLDQYIPEIKATRTCATNKIEYDKFMEDMDNAEKEMVLNYNTAQDGAYLTNGLNPVIEKYGGSSVEPTASFDLTKSAAGVPDQLNPHPDSCPDVDIDGNVTCLCRYTRYEWNHSTIKILHKHTDSRKKFSSSYSYAEDIPAASNSYNVGSCECECGHDLITYDEMISDIRSHYEGDRDTALGYVSSGDGGHADYKNKYKEAQDDFKMCTSLDTPISWLASKEDYTYKFEPTVTFKYNEKGNNNYPKEYKYSYDKNNGDVEIVQKDTALEGGEKLYFWSYTHAAGGEYDDPDSTNQYDCPSMYSLLDCTYVSGADTCNYGSKYKSSNCQKADMDGRNRPNGGVNFANDKNIKRVETVDYKYHLPVYQTYIPNGKVDELYKYNERAKLPSSSALKLEEEAAPVNINTVQGKYNYSIEVKDIVNKDDIRYKIRTDNSLKRNKPEPESPGFVKNYIDDLEKRFYSTEKNKGALNDGENEQYKCNYTVINEIYDPEKERVKFFYKPIDLTQDNPLDRIRGYNWNPTYNGVVSDLETRMKETGSDMQILKSADKFEFVLTPNVMKAIRKYNKGISEGYSDWNMLCTKHEDNGKDYYCESYFLTCLTTGVCDSIKVTGNTEGLYDSFKEVNQNSEFNRTELRSKLLQIQNGKVGG